MLRILVVMATAICLTNCTRISPGAVGVKVNQWGTGRGVMDAVEVTGLVWYNPLKYDVYEFPTTVQHKEYTEAQSFSVNSSDGPEFHVSPILNYLVITDSVVPVFKRYKKTLSELEDGFIKTAVYDAFRISTNSFTADSLIGHRSSFERTVRQLLDTALLRNGIRVDQFTSNLEYPDTLRKAIESKVAMVQQSQQAENKVRMANANADIQEANARGLANSMLIKAKAEAEANRLRQQSLTEMLIQQQFIEKWDGRLPQYGTVPQIFKDISSK